MRLRSTVLAMPILIASFLVYAWTAQEKVHIAALVVSLFFAGFSLLQVQLLMLRTAPLTHNVAI